MCSERPPINAYVTFGFSPRRRDFTSRFGRTSRTSIVGGRTLIWNPGFSFLIVDFSASTSRFSMSPSMLTTSLPSRMSLTFAITPEAVDLLLEFLAHIVRRLLLVVRFRVYHSWFTRGFSRLGHEVKNAPSHLCANGALLSAPIP